MSNNGVTEHEDSSLTVDKQRLHVCRQAAYELEALVGLLPGLGTESQEGLAVRGIAGRLLQLSSVLILGLCDDNTSTADLERDVFLLPVADLKKPYIPRS